MDNTDNKKEIIFFPCEKELQVAFYRLAQEKNVSPGTLFRAFMRKVIKADQEEKLLKENSEL